MSSSLPVTCNNCFWFRFFVIKRSLHEFDMEYWSIYLPTDQQSINIALLQADVPLLCVTV